MPSPLRILVTLGAAAMLSLSGCTGVYVSRPIGDRAHPLVPADWEGTWTPGNGAIVTRVADAAGGKLQFVQSEVRDGAFVTKTENVIVRESGGWLFATIVDDSNPGRYEWARIKLDEGQLAVWLPDKDAFRALVQSGKLKGTLSENDVALDPPTAAELKALTSGALGVPFNWDEPFVLRRLPR